MVSSDVVRLERSHFDAASKILSQAFAADPIFHYFAPRENQVRLSAIEQFSRIALHYSQPYNHIYTTPEPLKGIAIWIPPGQFPLNDFRLLCLGGSTLPFNLRLSRLGQFISLLFRVEKYHQCDVPQPHWYLFVLGVKPAYQSQGIGSLLMQPILEQADREGLPCYLETSTHRAIRFYQKQGFEVVRTVDLPKGELRLWTMKRMSLSKRTS